MEWFVTEYPKHCSRKLDMGKSCIRFKKIEEIPFDLIAELCTKMTSKIGLSCMKISLRSNISTLQLFSFLPFHHHTYREVVY